MKRHARGVLIAMAAVAADPGATVTPSDRAGTMMPPHATFFPFETREKAIAGHRTKSDRFLLLNGAWAVRWTTASARPHGFERPGFDVSGWPVTTVPGNGHGEADAPCPEPVAIGSYRREAMVPAAWVGQDVVLHVGAAKSPYRLWVNGVPAGRGEDGGMPAEFDVTRLVRPGRNVVAVQVRHHTNGDDADTPARCAAWGVTREVYMMAVPRLRIRDVFVHAGLDPARAVGMFAIDVAIAPGGAATTRFALFDADRQVLARSAAMPSAPVARSVTLRARLPAVRPWTAETPDLYFLLVELFDARGGMIQSSYARIGFRDVASRNGRVTVNRLPVVLRLAHPAIRPSMPDKAAMERDVQSMKRDGANALRTSDYGNDPYLYDLADRYGLYVIDDAKIAVRRFPRAASLDRERVRAMVERDKNHPSVLFWAAGRGMADHAGVTQAMMAARARDPDRPILDFRMEASLR